MTNREMLIAQLHTALNMAEDPNKDIPEFEILNITFCVDLDELYSDCSNDKKKLHLVS